MKKLLIFTLVSILAAPGLNAKTKAKFDINASRMVCAARSTTPGKKMVMVTAQGRNTDIAIEQAMLDAIAAITFEGGMPNDDMESIPPVLADGKLQYQQNTKFFNTFFKKGEYLNFVSQVNSTYPSGKDNVKINGGRKVRIYLIVDWQKLAEYYKNKGFKTAIYNLNN